MELVVIKDLKKSYELGNTKVEALKGINLTIQEGEFMTVAGASGSGKSTLLNMIGCIDRPTSGDIYIGDQCITLLKEKELDDIRLYTIGFIFQCFNLIPVLSIYENAELPLTITKGISKFEKRDRVEYFLEAVGLKEQMHRKPAELSGGQRQRVAVARALVTKPQIVLADEPTANLDSKNGIEIIELMHNICTKEKTTFIFSTHDPKVMDRASRVCTIKDGMIVEEVYH